MTDAPPGSWSEDMSGRERVRAVVETLETGATVQEIADRADVSRTTADDELERLEADHRVRETLVDGKKGYELNPVQLFFDELTRLIESRSRRDLEARLEELEAEREQLRDEFDAESLSAFRERLAEDDLASDEISEIRNVAATWEALDAEISRVRHALSLYDDVSDLATEGPVRTPGHS